MKKNNVFKRNGLSSIRAVATSSFFTIIVAAMILYGVNQAELSSVAEGRRVLEDGIRRAVITCYAIEGQYPDNLSYIEKNYGVHIDNAKYTVFYEIEASNIFPTITVIRVLAEANE